MADEWSGRHPGEGDRDDRGEEGLREQKRVPWDERDPDDLPDEDVLEGDPKVPRPGHDE